MTCLRAESRAIVLLFGVCLAAVAICRAQDLAPRAYVISPLHSNAVNLTYSFFDGNIIFDGTTPIADARARANVSILSISHSLNFFGRTAMFSASLPYGVGNFRGSVADAETLAYRSGLLASSIRFFMKLKGGPAMYVHEYLQLWQKNPIWVSIKLVLPPCQY